MALQSSKLKTRLEIGGMLNNMLTEHDQRVLSNTNYIHTTSPKFKKHGATDYNGLVHKLSGTSLISLIYGLCQAEFGFNTVRKVMRDIDKYNDMHLGIDKGVRTLDSGGYSIIAGDCSSIDVLKFINCYELAIRELSDNQTRILSLDIPFFIKEPAKCTVKHIYDFNKMSLTETKKAVDKTPELYNKLMFVQHWKMRKQYQVWNKLYDEMEVSKFMQHYAVGGLVGIGGAVNINFAPFIGPLFLQLSRYLNRSDDEIDGNIFNCHILGVYQLAPRFAIMFCEKLFRTFDEVSHCRITQDSINYLVSSQFKIRVDGHTYFKNTDSGFIHKRKFTDLTQEDLSNIYPMDIIPKILDEIKGIKNGERLKDVDIGIPAYSYAQLEIDLLFKKIIDEFQIIELFKTARNGKVLFNHLKSITHTIQSRYKSVLGAHFADKVLNNLQMIYAFYSAWYINDRSDQKMEDLMQKFITKVGFPADLT